MRNFNPPLIIAICILSVYACPYPQAYDAVRRFIANMFKPDNASEFKPRMVLEGVLPPEHTLPFVAYITVQRDNIMAECTGSIIAPRYVLTAFHCLLINETLSPPSAITVIVGSQYKSKGWAYRVRESYSTAQTFKGTKNWDDIVVLDLMQDIVFDYLTTAPIALGRSTPRIGDTLTIAGHGLRIVQRQRYRSDSYLIGNVTVRRSDKYCKPERHEICAGGFKQGSVKGDSGSPAFKIKNGKYVQVAMVTGGVHFLKVDKSKRDYQLIGMYTHGWLIKIAPFCGFIRKATVGAVSCQ